jgi:hypothetical protein
MSFIQMFLLKLGCTTVAKMEWPGTQTQDDKTNVHSALPLSCASVVVEVYIWKIL